MSKKTDNWLDGLIDAPANGNPVPIKRRVIEEMIDKALADREAENAKRVRSGKWSPSSFGKCYRAQYWNKIDEPKSNPPDARSLRVFYAGKLFHDFIQGLFTSAITEKLFETEAVKGYADLITEDVLDIKSQHSRSFWYLSKSNDLFEDKKPNWLQVGWYAMQEGKEMCGVVYVSKDDLSINEYVLPTADVAPYVEAELSALEAIDSLPPAEPRCYYSKKEGRYKECDLCSWRDRCKKEEKGQHENKQTSKQKGKPVQGKGHEEKY